LHAGWTKCAEDPKYSVFADAIEQALAKVDEYYQKTSNSNAYMFAMGNFHLHLFRRVPANHFQVLDPGRKLSYFKEHWPVDLQDEAIRNMEETVSVCMPYSADTNISQFKERYLELLELRGNGSGASTPIHKSTTTGSRLRRSIIIDGTDDHNSSPTNTCIDPLQPWLDEYRLYFNIREVVPEGMDAIQWWGVRLNYL
jgi:hypothetical protein